MRKVPFTMHRLLSQCYSNNMRMYTKRTEGNQCPKSVRTNNQDDTAESLQDQTCRSPPVTPSLPSLCLIGTIGRRDLKCFPKWRVSCKINIFHLLLMLFTHGCFDTFLHIWEILESPAATIQLLVPVKGTLNMSAQQDILDNVMLLSVLYLFWTWPLPVATWLWTRPQSKIYFLWSK